MSIASIWPVGVGTCWPAAASVAALNVYVAEPSPLMTGVTLLQPRKKSVVVWTSNSASRPDTGSRSRA